MKRIALSLSVGLLLAVTSDARAVGDGEESTESSAAGGSCSSCGGGCASCGAGARGRGIFGRRGGAGYGYGYGSNFPEMAHLNYLHATSAGNTIYTHQWNMYHAQRSPWHGGYYNSQWGAPVALVVPPTSAFQTEWAWGVGQTRMRPIYHQFMPSHPAMGGEGYAGQLRATPLHPSSTEQFGVYPVRGPW